jgi:hypothetical protein
MSLYYTHYLIPLAPEYRPEPQAVATFARGIIERGHTAKGATIALSPVLKGQPRVRQAYDTVSGITIDILGPSRRIERPLPMADTAQIAELAAHQAEYDLTITGEGVPAVAALAIGYVDENQWKPANCPYYHETSCRVRNHVVRLCVLVNEEDLHRPLDLANYRPRFGEDCSADERDGVFVHPEAGAITIPNAGCGTFWIEFNYGKLVFPRLKNDSVDLLDDSVVNLAREAFDCDFVQACSWG